MNKIPFCELCGKMLRLESKEGKTFGVCSCGYIKEFESGVAISEKNKKIEVGGGVISEDKNMAGFPHKCKKCGHEGCEVFDLGAFWSDESNVYLYKCKKCGYVDRQADGTSNI
jgi:DNA-directed RNA polymerase subunit M/transcription elongation factor TFIIS